MGALAIGDEAAYETLCAGLLETGCAGRKSALTTSRRTAHGMKGRGTGTIPFSI